MKYSISSVFSDYKYKLYVKPHSKEAGYEAQRLDVDGFLEVSIMGMIIYIPRSQMGIYGLLPVERKHIGIIKQQTTQIRKLRTEIKELKDPRRTKHE
jgi:hypothetical protein